MSTLRLFAIGFLAFAVTGCGQLVSERLAVSSAANPEKCTSKKMVILPFADYSYTKDPERAFRRNVNIMEGITARVTGKGFRLPVQEDLLQYLAEANVANLKTDMGPINSSPGYIQHSVTNDSSWSAFMRSELASIAEKEKALTGGNQVNTYALDGKTLAKIADNFNADFVMRGQILSYEFDEENTWSPLKRGIMPVLFAGASRAFFGVTNSDTYDSLGSAIMGGATGALIGYNASGPYDSTEKLNPGRQNSMIWGMGGAAMGYVASKGGKANQAAIQLRLWVQDPLTAEVVWTNSVKVLVKPQTVFAENREDKLFDTAVQQATAALVNDFVTKTKSTL